MSYRTIFLIAVTVLFLTVGIRPAGATGINLDVSGFVDMSFSVIDDTNVNTFSVDEFELDFVGNLPDINGKVRVDLQFHGTGISSIEQGYLDIPYTDMISFRFGRFNAPIGLENQDAPDMYQYSHSMLFDYGLPTNLSGVMISFNRPFADLKIYYVNGWDENIDDNNDKSFGTRLRIHPTESFNFGISYISGKEGVLDEGSIPPKEPDLLNVTDAVITWQGENLTLGGEYSIGTYKDQSLMSDWKGTPDSNWNGWMVMMHYYFNDTYGLTFRYDVFDDEDGERFTKWRLGDPVDESRRSWTIAPTFHITKNLNAVVEFRQFYSDHDVFPDTRGNPEKDMETYAAELTYSF